jgi:hypothetical protein
VARGTSELLAEGAFRSPSVFRPEHSYATERGPTRIPPSERAGCQARIRYRVRADGAARITGSMLPDTPARSGYAVGDRRRTCATESRPVGSALFCVEDSADLPNTGSLSRSSTVSGSSMPGRRFGTLSGRAPAAFG